jgi:hypothetical protein
MATNKEVLEQLFQLGEKINKLVTDLALHLSGDSKRDEKIDFVYKKMVGNGEVSIPEQIRNHGKWIDNANKIVWAVVLMTITNVGLVVWDAFSKYQK